MTTGHRSMQTMCKPRPGAVSEWQAMKRDISHAPSSPLLPTLWILLSKDYKFKPELLKVTHLQPRVNWRRLLEWNTFTLVLHLPPGKPHTWLMSEEPNQFLASTSNNWSCRMECLRWTSRTVQHNTKKTFWDPPAKFWNSTRPKNRCQKFRDAGKWLYFFLQL